MTDGNVYALKTPAQDTLDEVLKRGAQQLLAKAAEAEVAALLAEHQSLQVDGKQAVVRNGPAGEDSASRLRRRAGQSPQGTRPQ